MPPLTRSHFSGNEDSRRRRNPAFEIPPKSMPQEPEDEDRFFVVEKILDKRIDDDGNQEYLVRWKNYPPNWDSWEPRGELEKNCNDMVIGFDAKKQDTFISPDVHCVCKRPYRFNQGGMIQCFHCSTWFHFTCLQMNMEEANSYQRYYCAPCTLLDPNNRSRVKPEKMKTFYGKELAKSLGYDDSHHE